MAVTAANLHNVSVTDFARFFEYNSTGEAMATIIAANYFTVASLTGNMLKANDRVKIYASDGVGVFKVSSNGSTAALQPDGPVKTVSAHSSTATTLNGFGTNLIATTQSLTFLVPAPASVGDLVTYQIDASSTGTAILSSTGATILDGNGSTNGAITLAGKGDAVTLEAVSTSIWSQRAVMGTVDGTSITAKVWQPST